MFVRYYCMDEIEVGDCTVGWFLSEAIRHLRSNFGNRAINNQYTYNHIVGIRFRNATEMLDYWLTQYERPMPSIKFSDELEVIYSGKWIAVIIETRRLCATKTNPTTRRLRNIKNHR